MGNLKLCPMCGKQHGVTYDGNWGTTYFCEGIRFNLYDGLFYGVDNLTKERWMNAVYNYLERSPFKEKAGVDYYWKFFYEETDKTPEDDCKVNIYHLMKQYPYQVIDRIDGILLNLSIQYPALSDTFYIGDFMDNRSRLYIVKVERKERNLFQYFQFCKNKVILKQ